MTTPEKRAKWLAEAYEWCVHNGHYEGRVDGSYEYDATHIELYLVACEKRDTEFENETDNLYRQLCYEEKEHRRAMRTLDDCHRHTICELQTAMRAAMSAMRRDTAEAYQILAEALEGETRPPIGVQEESKEANDL